MATDAQLEALFQGVATAATNLTGAQQSGTNMPDIRNIPRTESASFVSPLQAAQEADLASVRRPGVPLDTTTGAPAGTRFKLAFTSTMPDAIKTLQAQYGPENITVSPAGQLVIRNLLNEETGQVKDMVVDENSMSAKDLLDLSGAVPQVIGAVLALRAGKATPWVGQLAGKSGFARDVLAGSIGSQVGAELSQRALAETANTLGEQLKERGKAAIVDAGFNVATAGTAALVPKGIARLRGPLSGRQTLVQTEAVDAIGRLEAQTGIRVPLSIGEETGNEMVMKSEAMLEKVPGGTGTIRAQKALQEQKLRDVQQFMLGQGPLPTESTVGLDAVKRLKELTDAKETMTAGAREQAADTASAEILSSFDSLSLPSRQLYKRPVGQAIREKANAKMAVFKFRSKALYDDVYATPGATDPIIPTSPLRTIAKEIKANLPKKTKVIEEVSDFVDAQGRPIVRTTTGKEVLREFVPKPLKKFIDEMASGLDPKMPLNEVVQMRQIINDAIDQADVLPGIGTRYLKQVSHALTDALEQGVKAAPDPTLATKLSKANEYYKTTRPNFERRGIIEIFRDPNNPGYVGDAEIVRRISAGEVSADRYFDFRDFLGKDSNEFKMLKRSVLDDIYETARIPGQGDVIDAKTFINSVRSLDREVADNLLGPNAAETIRGAEALGSLQGKIDVRDMDNILASGKVDRRAIKLAIDTQKNLDETYNNIVIKKFTKGETGSETIKPEEFVGRFLDTAKTPAEVEHVMNLLQDRPDITESIRRKTLEKFFADSARSPEPIDITKQIRGDPTRIASGQSMMKALGDELEQGKLKAVLGQDTMEMLKDLVRVESALGVKEAASRTVGGLTSGGMLSRLLQLDFKDALAIAKYKVVAATLANPKLRRILTKQVPSPDTADLARGIIASGPFIQAMAEEFKDESGVASFMAHINDALEGVVMGRQQEAAAQPAGNDAALENLFRSVAPVQP